MGIVVTGPCATCGRISHNHFEESPFEGPLACDSCIEKQLKKIAAKVDDLIMKVESGTEVALRIDEFKSTYRSIYYCQPKRSSWWRLKKFFGLTS